MPKMRKGNAMNNTKGFVTVATGDEKYYKLAVNLYLSYKKRGRGKYPFALICDRENVYSDIFDEIVLVNDIRKSTVDKLLMRNSPYDESIFIDADTLILDNVDDLWHIFEKQDDVSVFGCTLPLDSDDGWFTYEGSGRYKPFIKYLISMNGGIYYFRKSEKSENVFNKAIDIINDYESIDFKYFSQPQDEPLMAMSMVLNECVPCTDVYNMIILPACNVRVHADYAGNVYEGEKISEAKMIHFSTPRTELFLYNYINEINHHDPNWNNRKNYVNTKIKYLVKDLKFNMFHLCGAILRKCKLDSVVERIKKVIH